MGLRFDLGKRPQNEKNIKNIFDKIIETVTLSELKGLSLLGKKDDIYAIDANIYVAVIMGGSLKTMKRIYKKLSGNEKLVSCLDKSMPFIENNRIAHFEEMTVMDVL